MLHKSLVVLIAGVFVAWWSVNIFFNLPDNPVKIKYAREGQQFQSVMFQRWSFFAPPPKYNERLYYIFRRKSDTTVVKTLEVLEALMQSKHDAAPFNMKEEKLDYILSGSIGEVHDMLVRYTNNMKVKKHKEADVQLANDGIAWVWENRKSIGAITTLLKYGKLIAATQHLEDGYEMQILIMQEPVNKFIDRYKKETIQPATKTFYTPYIEIAKVSI